MDENGWIAREQILGGEARERVPSEFRAQTAWIANPPTLLLAIDHLLRLSRGDDDQAVIVDETAGVHMSSKGPSLATRAFLEQIYPKLVIHVSWYLRSQGGARPNSFKWRGCTPTHCL